MFNRKILKDMEIWSNEKGRKPLIIRGARQVGKTSLVHQFSKKYPQYLYLNLDLPEDRAPFDQIIEFEELVPALFYLKNLSFAQKGETLLFLDEIQQVPEAVWMLRYFYEKFPEITVIAAGSLLETLLQSPQSYPVGRVSYKLLRPITFPEFLDAMGERAALSALQEIPLRNFTVSKLQKLYHTFALIGGMPEVVAQYAETRDLISLQNIYESLLTSYLEDVEKYAKSNIQVPLIRHAIQAAFKVGGTRIKFQGFGHSAYGSREMAEALRTIEKALLIYLVYPVTQSQFPLLPDLGRSPRLHLLDTGLMNYFAGIQQDILGSPNLHSVYQGKLIEHLTGQELLALHANPLYRLNFWVREKKTSTAELDYLFTWKGKLIPIEVKSGAAGKLKSLHQFMDTATYPLAIRFYAGPLQLDIIASASGKPYHLLNLPYFLVSQLETYLEWAEKEIAQSLIP